MYNFKLLENEEIQIIFDDILLKTESHILNVSIIITNIRFIILSVPKDIESFRVGRMINYPSNKEVIFEIPTKDIIKVIKEEDYYKYILSNNDYFLLNSNKMYNFITQNSKL